MQILHSRRQSGLLVLAATATVLCVGTSARAQDIRIDLSTAVGSTAGNWNNISNLDGLTSNLIDFSTGGGTGVSIDGTGSSWRDFYGDEGGTFPDRDWLVQRATRDGAGLDEGLTGTYLFSGLTAGSYRIEVVSARSQFGYLNTFTVNGATADRTDLGTPVNTPWNSTIDGLTPGNWLIWDSVAPVNGSISLTDVADAQTLGMINAVRIVNTGGGAVPEPSEWAAMGVLGLALGGLVVRKRRSK